MSSTKIVSDQIYIYLFHLRHEIIDYFLRRYYWTAYEITNFIYKYLDNDEVVKQLVRYYREKYGPRAPNSSSYTIRGMDTPLLTDYLLSRAPNLDIYKRVETLLGPAEDLRLILEYVRSGGKNDILQYLSPNRFND